MSKAGIAATPEAPLVDSAAELTAKARELAREKNATILAHNYQLGEIQEAADFVGDSLELSIKAAKTGADAIVFCGVHFMAENAKLLSPSKLVLMPDPLAGCPMADMASADALRGLKSEHPGARVVTYVNSTAEVKALSDACCTSANAIKIVDAMDAGEVIFVPDKSLGDWVARHTRKRVILWDGFCPTHHRLLAADLLREKQLHPSAKVAVHPECTQSVRELADAVLSTSGILRYCRDTDCEEFIIGTEIGMKYRLEKENPGKRFYFPTQLLLCPNMKKTTLEKLVWSLEEMQYEITIPKEIARDASRAIERMLELTA
jgi:quinolinate synthase